MLRPCRKLVCYGNTSNLPCFLGIDRLCCCSREGKLQFHIIGPRDRHIDEYESGLASRAGIAGTSSLDDVDAAVEHAAKAGKSLQ